MSQFEFDDMDDLNEEYYFDTIEEFQSERYFGFSHLRYCR